jgi:hypothetical protein
MSVLPYNQIDVAQWQYTEPKRNPKNGWNVFLHDQNKRNPRMQLDRCRVPFGVQDGVEESANSSRKNLELSINKREFQEWAAAMDAQNVRWVTANSEVVLKKEMKQATVEALYRSLLSPQRGNYDPLLRVKVNTTGTHATTVFVVEDEGCAENNVPMRYRKGSLDDVVPHCEVVPIVEVVGLWFISKGFGMTLLATDLLVYPPAKRGGFQFALAQPAVQCTNSTVGSVYTHLPEPEESVLNAPTVVQASVAGDDSHASRAGTDEDDMQ